MLTDTTGAPAAAGTAGMAWWWSWLVGYGLASMGAGAIVPVVIAHSDARGAALGAIAAARFVPYLLCSPFAGLVARRFPADTVLWASSCVRLVLVAGVGLAVASQASLPVLVIAVFALVTAGTPVYPAGVAATRAAVPSERLEAATRRLVATEALAFAVGPAIGGVLLACAGSKGALLASVAMLGASAVLAVPLSDAPTGHTSPAPQPGGLRAASDELRRPGNQTAVNDLVAVNLVAGAAAVLVVPVAHDQLRVGAAGYGWLVAALGVGEVLGFVLVEYPGTRRLAGLWPGMAVVLSALSLTLVSVAGSLGHAVGFIAVSAVAGSLAEVRALGALQRQVTPSQSAAVFGLVDAVLVGSALVGSAMASAADAAAGHRAALVLLGLGAVLAVRGSERQAAGGRRWSPSGIAVGRAYRRARPSELSSGSARACRARRGGRRGTPPGPR